jgi:hypothetical protein
LGFCKKNPFLFGGMSMAYYRPSNNGYFTISTSSNSTTTGYYYTTNNYYGYSGTYTAKGKQEFKNKEVKHLLEKERGW